MAADGSDPARRKELINGVQSYVDERFDEANASGLEGRKFLFIVNAGSAVALMSFMGSSQGVRDVAASWWALALFCVGLFGLAVTLSCNYLYGIYLAHYARSVANEFYGGAIDYQEFARRLNVKTEWSWVFTLSTVSAFASLLLWIAGTCTVWLGLVPNVTPQPPVQLQIN